LASGALGFVGVGSAVKSGTVQEDGRIRQNEHCLRALALQCLMGRKKGIARHRIDLQEFDHALAMAFFIPDRH